MSEVVIIEKDLSYLIMQAAFEVHNELGPGFPEDIYEEAMNRELTRRGINLERQKEIMVYFKNEPLGKFIMDNIINGRIILEYKAVSEIARIHEQQALSYLKATRLALAIVINFGAERVQSSRVVNTKGKAKLPPRFPRPRNTPSKLK
ncbi:MAG: GxxExxY protein [Anaerolineae bacterium]|nr:GxxExxY protein [Anaerolineae bacterium]MCI0610920.1 GxxExxY protein [Anaerolineae bacterium]